MSEKGHIVSTSNKKTVRHKYRREKQNGKQLERSSSQTDEGAPRPDSATVPKLAAYAWLSGYYKNSQNLWSILRTKHDISTPKRARKEGIREERMEHEQRTPKESIQTHNRRTEPAELHRRFAELHMQKNRHT